MSRARGDRVASAAAPPPTIAAAAITSRYDEYTEGIGLSAATSLMATVAAAAATRPNTSPAPRGEAPRLAGIETSWKGASAARTARPLITRNTGMARARVGVLLKRTSRMVVRSEVPTDA